MRRLFNVDCAYCIMQLSAVFIYISCIAWQILLAPFKTIMRIGIILL